MQLSSATIDFFLFYDGTVEIQIMSPSDKKISVDRDYDTQVTHGPQSCILFVPCRWSLQTHK